MDKLQALKSRVRSGKSESSGRKQISDPDELIDIHHILMKEYGWIPLAEFRNLPIPTIWSLMRVINKYHELEKKEMDKIRSKRR